MNLKHLDLPVRDVIDAKAFFERHFGLRCVVERDGFALLNDDTHFALALSALDATASPVFPSGFHIGFSVDTEGEVRDLCSRIENAGVTISQAIGMLAGALTFKCLGPGGVIVEVAHRPAASLTKSIQVTI